MSFGVYVCVSVGISLGMELPAHGINVCLTSVDSVNFPKCLHHVLLPPAFDESSSCFIFLPMLGISCLFACLSHSVVYMVVCHCNFNLHSPDNS